MKKKKRGCLGWIVCVGVQVESECTGGEWVYRWRVGVQVESVGVQVESGCTGGEWVYRWRVGVQVESVGGWCRSRGVIADGVLFSTPGGAV